MNSIAENLIKILERNKANSQIAEISDKRLSALAMGGKLEGNTKPTPKKLKDKRMGRPPAQQNPSPGKALNIMMGIGREDSSKFIDRVSNIITEMFGIGKPSVKINKPKVPTGGFQGQRNIDSTKSYWEIKQEREKAKSGNKPPVSKSDIAGVGSKKVSGPVSMGSTKPGFKQSLKRG